MWELWDIFKLLFPLSDLWDIGLMGCRTCDVSDLWGDTESTELYAVDGFSLDLPIC
jgi:hypothetical protein